MNMSTKSRHGTESKRQESAKDVEQRSKTINFQTRIHYIIEVYFCFGRSLKPCPTNVEKFGHYLFMKSS